MTSSGFERAPEIGTERLILREQTAADLDATCALWSDPAVYRFIGGMPRPACAEGLLPDLPLVCMIAPENVPSIRLAGAPGFREYARTTCGGEPTVLFERARRDD